MNEAKIWSLPPTMKLLVEKLRRSGDAANADAHEQSYKELERQRDDLIRANLDGTIMNLYAASKSVKDSYNELSIKMMKLHVVASEGSFEELDFIKEPKLKYRQPEVLTVGWYQNNIGDLFHYDGLVWDIVPTERESELEYLG